MSIVRGEAKFVAGRDDADYLRSLGQEFKERFPRDGVRQWAAIVLREQGRESWQDIAAALEGLKSESSARSLYGRAKKKLRDLLAEKHGTKA